MTIEVAVATRASSELLAALNRLLPQLSLSAPPLTPVSLETLLCSEGVTLFVATQDSAVVGTLSLVIWNTPTGVRAWIEDVVVDSSARGCGVGRALTEAALLEASRRHARSVDLTSRPSRSAANALYRSVGFELRETNVYRFLVETDDH